MWTFCDERFKSTHSALFVDKATPYSVGMSIWHLLAMSGRWLVGKSSYEAFSFYLPARAMVERLDVKELENWAMIAWSLWNARNRFHFEHVQTHPTVILRVATSLLEEYQRLALAGPHLWALVSPIFFFFASPGVAFHCVGFPCTTSRCGNMYSVFLFSI